MNSSEGEGTAAPCVYTNNALQYYHAQLLRLQIARQRQRKLQEKDINTHMLGPARQQKDLGFPADLVTSAQWYRGLHDEFQENDNAIANYASRAMPLRPTLEQNDAPRPEHHHQPSNPGLDYATPQELQDGIDIALRTCSESIQEFEQAYTEMVDRVHRLSRMMLKFSYGEHLMRTRHALAQVAVAIKTREQELRRLRAKREDSGEDSDECADA